MRINTKGNYEGWVEVLILAFLGAMGCWAWMNRFVVDDAFISFRYAENLTQGHGLVFNIGDRVEGYTNFLYTLIMALPAWLGWDVVGFAYLVGMSAWVMSLYLVYRIARDCFAAGTKLSLLCAAFVASNYTYNIFATSGLENAWLSWLILGFFYYLFRPCEASRVFQGVFFTSAFGALAILTRLDAALIVYGCLGVAFLQYRRTVQRRFVTPFVGIGMVVILFMAWKLYYYGDVLPNTFYAKVGSVPSLHRGVEYARQFYFNYWYWPFLALLALIIFQGRQLKSLWQGFSKTPQTYLTLALFGTIVLWNVYVIRVNGDFMQYRFYVVLIPFIVLSLLQLFRILIPEPRWCLVGFMVLGLASFFNWYFTRTLPQGVEGREELRDHITRLEQDWPSIGRVLANHFSPDSGIKIAVTAAGAIPYYSKLYAVDMFGLNDRWVARNGRFFSDRPGHGRIANLEYLIDQGVDLIIAHPRTVPVWNGLKQDQFNQLNIGSLFTMGLDYPLSGKVKRRLNRARMVQIPMNEQYAVLALWISDHPLIQERMGAEGWRSISLNALPPIKEVDLREVASPDRTCLQRNTFGYRVIEPNTLLKIDLGRVSHARALQIYLGHSGDYYFHYLRGDQLRALQLVRSYFQLEPLVEHQLAIPDAASEKGFDHIMIAPSGGNGYYPIGALGLL